MFKYDIYTSKIFVEKSTIKLITLKSVSFYQLPSHFKSIGQIQRESCNSIQFDKNVTCRKVNHNFAAFPSSWQQIKKVSST